MNRILAVVIALTFLAAGCMRRAGNIPPENGTGIVAAVAIEPQRWILEQLAGDRVRTVVLMGRSADPENFDPPVSSLRAAERADIIFKLGNNPVEEALLSKLPVSVRVVDCSHGIDFIIGRHNHHHGSGKCHGEMADPHIWASVANVRVMAANMAAALEDVDTTVGAGFYAERLDSLNMRLDLLDRTIAERLASVRGRSFVVWHPWLSYFARDYGLRQIVVGEEGKELTVRQLREAIDSARRHNPLAVVAGSNDDPQRSETLGREVGTKVTAINILGPDWWNSMLGVADALSRKDNHERK